ncbi:hypothetical protein J3458_000724 [Metarhizium acridum]|uniref:uncharacterized protein n=1 Tax=Metarhizium acridum TaxID=92637 RepID=UPI001C6AFE32|nr:hypothetical protein J3458_000724 [Metarhizium acridum]
MMPSEAINVPVDHGGFEHIMASETTGGINSLTASPNDQLHLSLDNQFGSLPNVMNPSTFRYFRGIAFSGEKTLVDWALENPGLLVASPTTALNDLHQLPLSGNDHFGMITNSDSLSYPRGTAFSGKKTPVDWALHEFDTIGPKAESVGVYPGNSTHIGEILEAEMS